MSIRPCVSHLLICRMLLKRSWIEMLVRIVKRYIGTEEMVASRRSFFDFTTVERSQLCELTQNKSCHVNRKMKINGHERWIHVKMDMKVSRHREAISLPVVASPWSIKERRRVLGKSLSGGPCTSVTTRTKHSNSSLPVTS